MKLKLNTDKLEQLIFISKYKSARRFFDETNIMSRENYYQIRSKDKEIKWSHLQAIADILGVEPEIITRHDANAVSEPSPEAYGVHHKIESLTLRMNNMETKMNEILKIVTTDKKKQNKQNKQN
jgi:hypothetical protein